MWALTFTFFGSGIEYCQNANSRCFYHPYSHSLVEWVRALHTLSRLGSLNRVKADEKKGHISRSGKQGYSFQ